MPRTACPLSHQAINGGSAARALGDGGLRLATTRHRMPALYGVRSAADSHLCRRLRPLRPSSLLGHRRCRARGALCPLPPEWPPPLLVRRGPLATSSPSTLPTQQTPVVLLVFQDFFFIVRTKKFWMWEDHWYTRQISKTHLNCLVVSLGIDPGCWPSSIDTKIILYRMYGVLQLCVRIKFLAVRWVGMMTFWECRVDRPFHYHVIRCRVRTRTPPQYRH